MESQNHRCSICESTSARIPRSWCSLAFESALRRLADPVHEDTVTSEQFLLHRDDRLAVYYAPFDHINRSARVVLVGITPGRFQARIALERAAEALRTGAELDVALAAAKSAASFAGTMRANLVSMLDRIGLADALGIPTCGELFGRRSDLVATTSVISHPVFVRNGENYHGSAPKIERHPLLRAFAEHVLSADLHAAPEALVVPLGVAASRGVELAGIDQRRVLSGFPNPSGGNGHRVAFFTREKEQLTETVAAWSAASAAAAPPTVVGVSELRARAETILDRVERGENFVVVRGGHVVADLVPHEPSDRSP